MLMVSVLNIAWKFSQNSKYKIEKLFKKSLLKGKPNRWFKKATPTYHGWNEVEQTSDNSSDKEIYF